MLIVALVLAVIGLAALVTAVVTSNELIAWVCIGASVIGVLLLVVDAVRERSSSRETSAADDAESEDASDGGAEDYPEQPEPAPAAQPAPAARQSSDAQPSSDDAPEAPPQEPSGEGETGKPGAADAAKPD